MSFDSRTTGFLLALAATLLAACGGGGSSNQPVPPAPLPPPPTSPVFQFEGLDGRTIIRLFQHADRLFAATDNGLYGKFVGQSNWVLIGLAGFKVQSLAIVDDQHWLAATFPTNSPFVDSKLYETVNGGANWLQIANDFGPGSTHTERMYALLYDDASQQLFATGSDALASSADFGRSWRLLEGIWDTGSILEGLSLNPVTQQVWYGGQNSIEEMILRRYDLATAETVSFTRLLPSPSVIKSIIFDPSNSNRLLVSGEGGVLQSLDNGITWANLLGDVDHRFYFGSALNAQNRNIIYTAGWTKEFDNPQPLILEISRDRGSTWEQHQLDDPTLFGGVWSILAVTENARTVVYVGLQRGGIFRILPTGS